MEIIDKFYSSKMLSDYLINKIQNLSKKDKNDLHLFLDLSNGELSKIITGKRQKISAKNFYHIYRYFDETIEHLKNLLYPNLNLKEVEDPFINRNKFGQLMKKFEANENIFSPEKISNKTGINIRRIIDLYTKSSNIYADELLLIEMALEINQGELFEELYKNK